MKKATLQNSVAFVLVPQQRIDQCCRILLRKSLVRG
jgi:hypothetical protein